MVRSNSIKRQLSTFTTKESHETKTTNCKAACRLQENNTLLRKTQREMINDFIDILSKSSGKIKAWQTKYRQIFSKNKKELTEYEKNLWNIFDTAVSSIDVLTRENDNIVEKLQSVQDSIPNEKNDQPLKNRIEQMQLTSNQLRKEIKDLEEQKTKLEAKIEQQRTGAFCYTVRTKVFRTDPNKPKGDLREVLKSIKSKNKSYTNATKNFQQEAADAIKQNTENELKLTISMKQQFNDFVKALNINSKPFKTALQRCNPINDLNNWKQNILYSITEFDSTDEEEDQDENINRHRKFDKFQSIENENSDEETWQPLKSIKSRPIKNENSDEKTNRHLKSLESRSTENENIDERICQPSGFARCRSTKNENSDNKTTIRQSSLPSSSIVGKNRAKRKQTPQQSPKVQPVHGDDNDDDNLNSSTV